MSQARGSVAEALERSVAAAVAAGRIDPDAQAALVAVARKVAAVMDEPDWPIVCKDAKGNGKLDNVSPSVLLKYCEALGICPEIEKGDARRNRGELAKLRGELKSLRVVG